MEIALTILYSALFIFLIYKLHFFKIPGISPRIMSSIFVIKVLAGTMLMLIYTHYYKTRESADVFKYFDDGKVIYGAFHEHPGDYFSMVTGINSDRPELEKYYHTCNFWYKDHNYKLYNDNRTIIRFNAIAMLFSFGYFSVHTVFMAFLSFIGLTALLKVFIRQTRGKKYGLLAVVYLVPSVLLWSSGVLKEGILLFALGLITLYVVRISQRQFSIKYTVLFLVVFALLVMTKIYVLAAVLPGLAFLFIINKYGEKWHFAKFVLFNLLVIVLAFNAKYLVPSYDLAYIIAHKQHDFIGMVDSLENVGSKIYLPPIEPNGMSILKNSPNALFNSVVRPHPFEIDSLMMAVSSLENILVIIFIIICLVFSSFRKLAGNYHLFYLGISFALFLFIITGLTTPVLGAIVRYKAPAIPFLLLSFLLLLDTEKLYKFINRIIKPIGKQISVNSKT